MEEEKLLDNETKEKPPSNKTEKDIYFEQLELWVKHANLSHNAVTSFPYYFMANYPNILAGQQIPQFFGAAAANPVPQPPQQQQQNAALERFTMNIMNRNRFRQENMFENQLRNAESNYLCTILLTQFVIQIVRL